MRTDGHQRRIEETSLQQQQQRQQQQVYGIGSDEGDNDGQVRDTFHFVGLTIHVFINILSTQLVPAAAARCTRVTVTLLRHHSTAQ